MLIHERNTTTNLTTFKHLLPNLTFFRSNNYKISCVCSRRLPPFLPSGCPSSYYISSTRRGRNRNKRELGARGNIESELPGDEDENENKKGSAVIAQKIREPDPGGAEPKHDLTF